MCVCLSSDHIFCHFWFPVVGEVQVATPSITITEGANGTVCVVLTAASGSPTSLANPLIVELMANLNAGAGLHKTCRANAVLCWLFS